jgi:drug/metabolite transporter (DMT)-like permease
MPFLVIASLLWAFSFGLIKHYLVGLPPAWVACVRLLLSLLLFAPVLKPRAVRVRDAAALAGVGAVQHGLMYVFYLFAYRFLSGAEVALFTVLTPVYVTLMHDAGTRRFHRLFLLAACLAAAGSAVIVAGHRDTWGTLGGFLLVQASNLCFAAGQLAYRRVMRTAGVAEDHRVFAWVYLGALAMALAALPLTGVAAWPAVSARQWVVLAYLGLVPSGVAFFLWNAGARRVASGTLAAMNNAKVPLGVIASLAVFGERPPLLPLLAGGAAVLAAVWLCERDRLRSSGRA